MSFLQGSNATHQYDQGNDNKMPGPGKREGLAPCPFEWNTPRQEPGHSGCEEQKAKFFRK
ncbi:hypothetical protein Pla8534_33030 [Lignipirellula cremea]|uniref:Uncharacterized protein n=1 Tax=Lignipirellula cremea TaxID=2528010 RepID=A0A518DUI7_9BACT|nr:hypothetical protein Pla8534_33030 [Lignipirellula cremea]